MPEHMKLVIVESPAKAKTIAQYLGDGYDVQASVGHIRDLIEPKNLPPELKKGSLGKFSIDVENDFAPYYVVSDEKKRTVADLKRALKDADELYLATDEDREGEAIAWHLLEVLKPTVPVKRMVFHEITKDAIEEAKNNPRELDTALVDAQETRRILDRLYGFEVSPVLWRKVGPGLSAGRVQSAATRLVVDRERERQAFVAAAYWDLIAELVPQAGAAGSAFESRLARLDGRRVASGRDYDDQGRLTGDAVALDEAAAESLASALRLPSTTFTVSNLETKPYTRRPAAPFTTSTLQQEAARKLRFSARQTMSVAQGLYENGYITYMRTDSPTLSQQAITAARSQATKLYGADSIPEKPRVYTGKSKNAQEAHEAIRPSGEVFRTPSELSNVLRGNEFKLYDLIWKRTVASQMADARGSTASVTIAAGVSTGTAEFTASGTVITFRGFLAAYEEGHDEERNEQDAGAAEDQRSLPPLTVGQVLDLGLLEAKGHETSPPPRYTEASLVKALEELGIGRPSTYASIISTIIDRGYVTPRGTALVPSWIAFSVVRLLEEHFGDLVEYDFTAEMEDDLDRIADGEADRVGWLKSFYFGSEQHRGLRKTIDNLGDIDAREVNSVRIADDITLRIGKYGPYLEVPPAPGSPADAPPRRVNVPEELAPDELTEAKARELIDAPIVGDRVLGINPANGKTVVARDGRYGPYVTELEPEPEQEPEQEPEPEPEPDAPAAASLELAADSDGMKVDVATGEIVDVSAALLGPKKKAKAAPKKKVDAPKPRTASLFKTMDPATVDLETALQLLDLPRVVGKDPESGEDITAQNGRYGPYIKKGTDSRSLESEEQIFSIDLPGALEVFAQPKYGARRPTSALKEFEADPESGKPIKVRDGRFGPYVTDGVTNATIPRGEEVEAIDFERAVQLLADKRAKGPAKPKSSGPRSKRVPAKRK
ncbi:MAG TPA: type I DNA topoisomerase [Pseudolysinimonas sp.]